MRGRGDFQRAQMKHRDARVAAMCGHLRAAIDIYEEITSHPFRAPEPEPRLSPPPPPPAQPARIARNSDKLAFSINEAATVLGIGRTMLYQLIRDGDLKVFKIGSRTLVCAVALRAWLETRRR